MRNNHSNEDYIRNATRNRNVGIIICIVLIVGAFIFNVGVGKSKVSLGVLDDELIFYGPDDTNYYVRVPLDQIRAVDTVSNLDYGTLIDGSETKYFRYGIWENDAYGTYTICASAKISTCMVVTSDSGYFLTNYESDDTTVQFAEALKQLLVEEGYWEESLG